MRLPYRMRLAARKMTAARVQAQTPQQRQADIRRDKAKRYAEIRRKYATNPAGFFCDILGIHITYHHDGAGIGDVIDATRAAWITGDRCYIIAGGGTGLGKTYAFAAPTLVWFLFCHAGGDVAPRARVAGPGGARAQIREQLWSNFMVHMRRLEEHLGEPYGRMYAKHTMRWAGPDGPDHNAEFIATDEAGQTGGTKAQGLHHPLQIIAVDEAEGVGAAFFDSLITYGPSETRRGLVLMMANPMAPDSPFADFSKASSVRHFTLSVLTHPNVVTGTPVVPGAVGREVVETAISKGWAVEVDGPDDENYHFELPWRPGVWYRPVSPAWFSKIFGVVSPIGAVYGPVPHGVIEAACSRTEPIAWDSSWAAFGLDPAGTGDDEASLWVNWGGGHLWNAMRSAAATDDAILEAMCREREDLMARGVTRIVFRFDAGGGYAKGISESAEKAGFECIPIHFGGKPMEPEEYRDSASELYGVTAEVLKRAVVHDPTPRLKIGLSGRRFSNAMGTVTHGGHDVIMIESKKNFKKRARFSPDDADALCLAAVPIEYGRRVMSASILA